MRPAADDYDLVEPRLNRVDQTSEVREVTSGTTQCSPLISGPRILLRISSACALPRAGKLETSSHTWRMSATGRPSRSTAPLKRDAAYWGTRRLTSARC